MTQHELISAPRVSTAVAEAARAADTPALLIDRRVIARCYRALSQSLPGVAINYAVKANPHSGVLGCLAAEGAGFEVSSPGELTSVLALGVSPQRIISSNPVKRIDFLRIAHSAGVDRFVVDSPDELTKIAQHAPGSRISVRLKVDNSGSEWPLARKYGVEAAEAVELFERALLLGLRPWGTTFHVGSQCRSRESWRAALLECAALWRDAADRGVRLYDLNIGGGFPVRHLDPIPDLYDVGGLIGQLVREHYPQGVRVSAEPGRVLVGTSAVLVSSVIGKAVRDGERWLYLDAGVYNALMETIEHFDYELATEQVGPQLLWTVAGPSCDSVDVMFTNRLLPELAIGDRIYIQSAGAYTLSYASNFNGFAPPEVHFVDGLLMEQPTSSARTIGGVAAM